MRPFTRKRDRNWLPEAISASLDSLRGGLTKGKVLKASLIAGGLTAGSAGISSLRRREKGAGDDS